MLPAEEIKEYLQTAAEIAEKAGVLLVDEFKSGEIIRNPGTADYDIKIDSDQSIEKFLVSGLKKKYSGHGFAGEESAGEHTDKDYVWFIDPIDGTNNFAIGVPYFGISLALTYKNQPVASVIVNPILNDIFTAGLGSGAFKNGVKFEYNGIARSLNEAVISFIRGHKTFKDAGLFAEGNILQEKLLKLKSKRVINLWAPTIDYTLMAQGKIDLLISFEDELQETYAGSLLCREAGVPVCNFRGEKAAFTETRLLIGREKLIKEILSKI